MRKIRSPLLLPLMVLFLSLVVSLNLILAFSHIEHTNFVDLAYAFLHGRLSLEHPVRFTSYLDSAAFLGRYYVYFGPVPAILLMPFVAVLGPSISQHPLTVVFGIVNFFLFFRLARALGLSPSDALWMAIAFIFGSFFLFLTLVNISAYSTQIIGLSFLLAALLVLVSEQRWLLAGVLFSLAGMTRFSLYFAAPFFLLELIRNHSEQKRVAFARFFLPVFLSIGILGMYNQARFGTPLETGYTYNQTWPVGVKEALNYGLFSLKHLPGNLYFLLFKGPDAVRVSEEHYVLRFPYLRADRWGMGILFTSPYFFHLLFARLKGRYDLSSLLASATGLFPSLLYGGIGVWQYGYRYALDIFPFLFILLSSVFASGIPRRAKILIVYSVVFNLYLMGSIWNIYPFGIHW